jgi:hypothetical protein
VDLACGVGSFVWRLLLLSTNELHTHVEVHVRPGVDSYLILALAFLCIGRLRTVRRSSQTLPSEVDDLEGNSVWSA